MSGDRPCPACDVLLAEEQTHWSLGPEPIGGYVCPEPVGLRLRPEGCTHYCEEGHVTADEYVMIDGANVTLRAELAEANADAERLAFMLDFHRWTPTGRSKRCSPTCDACAVLRAHEERV